MASDALTSETFFENVRKSGLLDESRLNTFRTTFPQGLPLDPKALADAFLRAGLLSKFQTEAILRGKWKGLVIGGKYRFVEMLGAGGMGAVYLCEHVRMRRLVALKMLPDDQVGTPGALERFEREARAAAALHHPHIVQAFDMDQDGNKHFLVMEYVEGMNLQQFVERIGKLSPVRAAHFIAQAALGLHHANEAGLVHRDIKPSNLLLDRTGTVKILDMGLARFFRDSTDNLTKQYDEKSVLGTADYISPEQALHSSQVDIRADIYSFGATFYFLLTSERPFGDGNVTQKLLWHQLREVPSPRDRNPAVSKELAAIVMRMMAKKPEEHYQTPHAVADALAPWTRIELAAPTESELPPKSWPGQVHGPSSGTLTAPASGIRLGAPLSGPTIAPRRTFGVAPPAADTMVANADRTPSPAAYLAPAQPTALKSAPKSEPSSPPPPRNWLPLGIGVGVLVAVLLGIYFGWRGSSAPNGPPPPPGTLIVSKVGGAGHYPTLMEALHKATPGATIRVEADDWDEAIVLKEEFKIAEQITLEGHGFGGEPTRWHAPRGHSANNPLLSLIGVPHLTVRNFLFDGEDRLGVLVNLSRKCHGFVGERLRFRGYTKIAVRFSNCDGEAHPIKFRQLYAQASKSDSAVFWFEGATDEENRQITISDSRFDGIATAVAIRLAGDSKSVNFERNRFFNFRAGLWYPPTDAPFSARITFTNNTFYQVHTPFQFDVPPSKATLGYGAWLVTSNLFIDSARLVAPATVAPDWLVTKVANATNKDQLDGATLLKAAVMEPLGLERRPDDDKFLFYPANSPLNTAIDRKPVGATPSEK